MIGRLHQSGTRLALACLFAGAMTIGIGVDAERETNGADRPPEREGQVSAERTEESGQAGSIPRLDDAPPPLSPSESAQCFRVPEGYRLELVAAEPLIREPTGVCWDAQGRMYVSELHGYNLEGQLDIEALNRTGKLDRVVRRIGASEEAKQAALAETYGTVKLLTDSDGDGQYESATIFADRLPPCYGICPIRDGIIAVGAPDIVFLADRDGDGRAEVRETLFTGFGVGGLERGINCPQWGFDGWVYVGAGHPGGPITGPLLKDAVDLPNTDFRIRPDGTAIEPVAGRTHTMGFTFTPRGERIVVTTRTAGILVAPISWDALSRNPDAVTGSLELGLGDVVVYPTSQPHPWRTRRAQDPGFNEYYTENYGIEESAPNGYFTSACSPLVYRDNVLPGLTGQLLACEPAQNLVHRGLLNPAGTVYELVRAPGEEKSEFLTSIDPWFHPIALSHGPDGCIYIVDFYREIIEDYSAIPRYLQQQYGLVNGQDRGRIWKLTHAEAPSIAALDMSDLEPDELVEQLSSPLFWRRQTASRLLVEQQQNAVAPAIAEIIAAESAPEAVIAALHTLDALGALDSRTVAEALALEDTTIQSHALRLCGRFLDQDDEVFQRALRWLESDDPAVLLQLAVALGESQRPEVIPALAQIARAHGRKYWMDVAVISALSGRAADMVHKLLQTPDEIGEARALLGPIVTAIGTRRDPDEISRTILTIIRTGDPQLQQDCWDGLQAAFSGVTHVPISDEAVAALRELTADENPERARIGRRLIQRLGLESEEERAQRIADTLAVLGDIEVASETQLAAVADVASVNDERVTKGLLEAIDGCTPQVRQAILDALFSRQNRLPRVLDALESGALQASVLTALQRSALLEHPDPEIRRRAAEQLEASNADLDEQLAKFAAALNNKRDPERGAVLYREKCATCHQAHGVGVAVGPDLGSEFKRAEETILQDILAPSSVISAGYTTYMVLTKDGLVVSGILSGETAGSVTVKQAKGVTQTVLRKDIEEIRTSGVSLMPEELAKTLAPQDVADVLAWLRSKMPGTTSP